MKLIVGLGNPGPRYRDTRHNVGFMAVERLAERLGIGLSTGRFEARAGSGTIGKEPVWLVEPQTFMNLSGRSVAQFSRFYKLTPADIVVLHDEIDLPLGRLRVKQGGGTAGHNGLKSMVAELGSPDFFRIRLGVGRPFNPAQEVVDWVLEPFAAAERPRVDELTQQAADAAECLVAGGLKAAQERFNRKPEGANGPGIEESGNG